MRPNTDSLFADNVELLASTDAAGEGPRRFSMLAYTGAVVDRFWGRLVIDLDGLDCGNGKRPILYGHSERVAFSESIERTPRGIEIRGQFLGNDLAEDIQRDMRQGFPWQASIRLSFVDLQELDAKTVATVNGREVQGPLTIAKKSKLLESSFVECGADNETSAEALKRAEAHRMSDAKSVEAPAPSAVEAFKASERERLAKIRDAMPGRAELAIERFEAGDTPEQAKALAKAIDDALARERAKTSAATSVQVVPFAASDSGKKPADTDEELSVDDQAEEGWKRKSVRSEFLTVDDYRAFLRATEEGRVRMCAPGLAAKK